MVLDERKQKILEAIIHNYMESGEPKSVHVLFPEAYGSESEFRDDPE